MFVSLHTNPNVYFNEKPPFTEEEEKRFIQEFLEAVQAERIYCSESEVLYRIPDQAEKPGDGEPKAAGL